MEVKDNKLLAKLSGWTTSLLVLLEGWKSIIGLLVLYLDGKYQWSSIKAWYVDVFFIFIYIWTGYGIFDKLKRTEIVRKRIKNGKS
jgi:hypothetical protein